MKARDTAHQTNLGHICVMYCTSEMSPPLQAVFLWERSVINFSRPPILPAWKADRKGRRCARAHTQREIEAKGTWDACKRPE